jgi:hypothetical protein
MIFVAQLEGENIGDVSYVSDLSDIPKKFLKHRKKISIASREKLNENEITEIEHGIVHVIKTCPPTKTGGFYVYILEVRPKRILPLE